MGSPIPGLLGLPAIPGLISLPSILGQIGTYLNTAPTSLPAVTGPWRPPQWSRGVDQFKMALTMTTTDPNTGQQVAYVFDGIIRAEHEQRAVVTQNPVQTGAAIADHVYVVPPRVTIEVAMSDSMQSFTFGQFATGPSRSVSAYQTLVAVLQAKNPVQLATRLRQYDTMVITSITAPDNHETTYALKALVTFENVLTATVQTANAGANSGNVTSAIPQTTDQTLTGKVQPLSVPSAFTNLNNVNSALPPLSTLLPTFPQVSNPGTWSSTNINTILTTFNQAP